MSTEGRTVWGQGSCHGPRRTLPVTHIWVPHGHCYDTLCRRSICRPLVVERGKDPSGRQKNPKDTEDRRSGTRKTRVCVTHPSLSEQW